MACGPSSPFVKRQPGMDQGTSEAVNAMTPTSPILEGPLVGRSIDFGVEQAIGKSPDGCGITSYRASPLLGRYILRMFKTGTLHGLVAKNPVQPVESRSQSDYRAIIITPEETRAILKALPHPLHRILHRILGTDLRRYGFAGLRTDSASLVGYPV